LIRFWTCPVHREHVDEHGRKDATVEWRGGIAHCTTGDCAETSAPPAVSEEERELREDEQHHATWDGKTDPNHGSST
jgi:hypothetical protein